MNKSAILIALCLSAFYAHDGSCQLRDSLPQAWTMQPALDQTLPASDNWWANFNDPQLTHLIALGEERNYNVAMAAKRIKMARQQWNAAGSAWFPTISLSAGWTAQQSSSRTTSSYAETQEVDYFQVGADMNWEIDVFGKIASQRKQKKAAWNASRADFAAMQVSVAANIAKNYWLLRMYQLELSTALKHLELQREVVHLAEVRKSVGLASGLDVAQAQQVVMTTEAAVPQLRANVRTTTNALCLLLGIYSSDKEADFGEAPDSLRLPEVETHAGVPANLLRRRPDVVEAEFELAQYAAAVGIAKKDFLPTISLSGSVSTMAHRFGDLFSDHSFSWEVTPQLTWTMFEGLARKYALAEARAQMEAGIDNYNLTLMTAVSEVENALTTYQANVEQARLCELASMQAQKTLRLSLDLYKQGLDNYTTVAQAQISNLKAEMDVISSRASVLTSLATLYQALGGGWSVDLLNDK